MFLWFHKRTMASFAPVSRVGIVAKHHLRQAAPHLADISTWLKSRGLHAVFESATAALCVPPCDWPVRNKEALVSEVDIVLVLGGDGTLLGMADRIAEAGLSIPILGVNFGSLGFLTEVTLPELYPSLESAVSGRARIEERLMLQSTTARQGAWDDGSDVTMTLLEDAPAKPALCGNLDHIYSGKRCTLPAGHKDCHRLVDNESSVTVVAPQAKPARTCRFDGCSHEPRPTMAICFYHEATLIPLRPDPPPRESPIRFANLTDWRDSSPLMMGLREGIK